MEIILKSTTKKHIATMVAAIAAACASSQVLADAPVFEINPQALPGVSLYSQFAANQITGSTSTLLQTVGNTNVGSGWLSFGSFSLNGSTLDSATTGVGGVGGYRLYVTFELSETYREGTGFAGQQHINGAGTVNDLTKLDIKFYADPTRNTTFAKANANTGARATVGGTTSDDILLGVGTLLGGISGYNDQGGAGINSTQSFALCSGAGTASQGGVAVGGALGALGAACTSGIGSDFFAEPDPFYTLAFDAFNNTRQGVVMRGNLISINNAAGNVDFNVLQVPEPGTYAMLGAGLAVLAVSARRRRKT